MTSLVIDTLTAAYKRQINRRTKKSPKTFYADFRIVIGDFLQRRSEAERKYLTLAKYRSWDQIWDSDELGGKRFFADDYDQIQRQSGGDHSQVLLQLKRKLQSATDLHRWTDWYEWVQLETPHAPQTPPPIEF